MVCHGPNPPENDPQDLTPPLRHDLIMNGPMEDSDEEHDHIGYEPLPQGPDALEPSMSDDSEDEAQNTNIAQPIHDVPSIETMETTLTRDVWNNPRSNDPIQMDSERAEQVMQAMANFALPMTSIPEWAQSISEEQWKETLKDRIEKIKSNR